MPISLNPATKSLILKYNQLQTVDASVSFYPNLQNLNLSSNHLQILPGNIFIAQQALERLNLCDNKLQKLTEDTFSGLKRVKKLALLNLARNNLNMMDEDGLKGFESLETLYLEDN